MSSPPPPVPPAGISAPTAAALSAARSLPDAVSATTAAALSSVRSLPDAVSVARHFGSLDGLTFLVTGASSGLGLQTALALCSAGGTVVMACRPGAAAEAAAASVRAAGSGPVHLLPLDLAQPASVRACAAAYRALPLPSGGALSALVLNAGIICPSFGAHSPGSESTLRINLLGHALLHDLLHASLLAAPGARVVVLGSESHRRIQGPALDLARELPPQQAHFECHRAYAFSNLARLLWARALAAAVPYPVLALHPCATAATGMGRHMGAAQLCSLLALIARWELRAILEGQSAQAGARTQTWCAVAPREALQQLSGRYLSGNVCHGGPCALIEPSPLATRQEYVQGVKEFVDAFVERERGGAGEGK